MFGLLSILIASITQGVTGFGFALIAVPLLSFTIPELRNITPIIVIYSLITNIIIAYKSKQYINLNLIMPLIFFSIIATPIGTYVLKFSNAQNLKIIVGIIISITAFAMLKSYKVKIKNKKISYGIVGILSGFLNGSTGLSGPPLVLFFMNQNVEKEVFRSNLTFFGIVTNIFAIIIFIMNNIVNNSVIRVTLCYLPALILGAFIGTRISKRVNESIFKYITIYLVMILGIYTFISSIMK